MTIRSHFTSLAKMRNVGYYFNVPLRHRIRFYQQLAVLMRAGLLLRASLERLSERMPSPQLSILLEKVNAGERLGDAFTAARFSPFECHLVAAGEKSGHLDTIFEHLADFWNRELEMRRAILRPLYYPIGVLHLAVLIGALVEAVMGSWIVAVIHAVEALACLYVAAFVLYTLIRVSWSSPIMQRFWLVLPLIGPSLKSAYAYRWITSLRVEFGAGISIYKAVGDAWRASGFLDYERLAEEGEQSMLQGARLSQLVLQWRDLPRDWIDFIETGEVSGKLNEAFISLEAEAKTAWNARQKQVEDLLPKIIYFVALLVAAGAVVNVGEKVFVDPMNEVTKALDGK